MDRDGTLIKDAHYLKDPAKLEIIHGVGDSLIRASVAGYYLFMHTNQSGIARGYYEWSDVHACNQRMHDDFGWPEDFFLKVCIAPESPGETGGYRKPSSRFEREMIKQFELDPKECWVIGDKWLDPQTGLNAGMSGALVKTGKPIDGNTMIEAKKNNVPIYEDINAFVNERILAYE